MSNWDMTVKKIDKLVFIDEGNYENKAMSILKAVGNLRLIGDTGVAKTTLVHHLAGKHNWKLFEEQLSQESSRWDLLGCDTLVKGSTEVRGGIIYQWLMTKPESPDQMIVLYLDEYNHANPSVTTLLNSLTDFRGKIRIPEFSKDYFRLPNHKLIISMNPAEKSGYTGTFLTNIAQARRFESIRMEYLNITSELKLLTGQKFNDGGFELTPQKADYRIIRKLVELAQKTRTLYTSGKLSMPITTGNLLNYIKIYELGLGEEELLEVICAMFRYDESSKIISVWGEVERKVARTSGGKADE